MADVYVNTLTIINTEPTTTDSLVVVNRNTNEGKIIDYNLLADVILNKITSKQYSGLNTTSKLLVGAINELDSDVSSLNSSLTPQRIDISNVTWSVNVNTNYTWFYKVGCIVFFQIFITDTITTSTSVGTLPSGLYTLHQEWFVAAPSNGGNNTCRASIGTDGIVSTVLAGSGVSIAAPYIKGAYIAAS